MGDIEKGWWRASQYSESMWSLYFRGALVGRVKGDRRSITDEIDRRHLAEVEALRLGGWTIASYEARERRL